MQHLCDLLNKLPVNLKKIMTGFVYNRGHTYTYECGHKKISIPFFIEIRWKLLFPNVTELKYFII